MLIIGTVIFSEKRLPPFSTFQPKNQSFLVLIRGPETFTDDERLSKLWIFMILQCHITYLLFWSQIFCKKTRCSSLCNRVCSREFPEKNFPFPEFFRKDFFQNREFSGQIEIFLLHFSMIYGLGTIFSKIVCKKIPGFEKKREIANSTIQAKIEYIIVVLDQKKLTKEFWTFFGIVLLSHLSRHFVTVIVQLQTRSSSSHTGRAQLS